MIEEIICDICNRGNSYIYRDKAIYFLKSARHMVVTAACVGHYGLYDICNWTDISVEEYLRYKKLEAFK